MFLQHCPTDVEAEIKNKSTCTTGQDEQNVVNLLLMLCDITHNMREIKQGVMAIVECVVEMDTTTQKSSETTEE